MDLLLLWSYVFPVLIYGILQLNKMNLVWASAVGVLVQCAQVIVGALFAARVGGYILSMLPALGFFENWLHFRKAKSFL